MGIFTFDKNSSYKEINSKFCGTIGYDREELFNCNFPEPFWDEKFFLKHIDEIELFKKTGLLKIETFFCTRNKIYFPVLLYGSIIPKSDTSDVEYIIIVEDISDRKKAERELKLSQEMLISLNTKLEEIIRKRTEELHLVMKQKNEFINQLGHDLKNPLNPMVTLIPVIHEKESNNDIKEMVSVIMRNVMYMQDLIFNTIELAKLDFPNIKFSFEPVNLKELIDNIITTNFSVGNVNNITIINEITDDIIIEVDKIRFNELLINIIDNAIKYGKENGSVKITSESINEAFIQLNIIDNGIGMNEKELQHVFDEFYKGTHKNTLIKGSGLGMSICKRITERHGGKIWVESPGSGKGSTVFIQLPFKPKISQIDMEDYKLKNIICSLKEIT